MQLPFVEVREQWLERLPADHRRRFAGAVRDAVVRVAPLDLDLRLLPAASEAGDPSSAPLLEVVTVRAEPMVDAEAPSSIAYSEISILLPLYAI